MLAVASTLITTGNRMSKTLSELEYYILRPDLYHSHKYGCQYTSKTVKNIDPIFRWSK